MRINEKIPSDLSPIEVKHVSDTQYPIQYDLDGNMYIEVPITSDGNIFVQFYDKDGNRINDVNFKLDTNLITIYIGSSYDHLDVAIYSNGTSLDENRLDLFCLDLAIVDRESPEWADLSTYRLAIGKNNRQTYNITMQAILDYLEDQRILPQFLTTADNLESLSSTASQARQNLSIESKSQTRGKWYVTTGNNVIGGDGLIRRERAMTDPDNDPAYNVSGMNVYIPNNSVERSNYNVCVGKDFVSKQFPDLASFSGYKINQFRTTGYVCLTPVRNKGKAIITSTYPRNNIMEDNCTCLFRKYYFNNSDNPDVYYPNPNHHSVDSRNLYYYGIQLNMQFAVRKNVDHMLIYFSNVSVAGGAHDVLSSYFSNLYSGEYYDIAEYNIRVANNCRFHAHYKGECYKNDGYDYEKNENSDNGFYNYKYEGSQTTGSGIRELSSIGDYHYRRPRNPYIGDLRYYTPPHLGNDNFNIGNSNTGYNAFQYSPMPDIYPKNYTVAHLFKTLTGDQYGIVIFFRPSINYIDNIGEWGNNEWFVEGDVILP